MSAETPTSTPLPVDPTPPSPVPFLRRVRIRGYKSIESCDVTLSPLTILVGRNASGKSNFIDALSFLRDLIALNLEEAVKRHGGASAILCRSRTDRKVEIEAQWDLPEDWKAQQEIAVHFPLDEKSHLECEFGFSCVRDGTIHEYRFKDDGIYCPTSSGDGWEKWTPKAPNGDRRRPLSLPNFDFSDAIRSISTYGFDPARMRKLDKPEFGYLLEKDGGNLSGILDTIRRIDPWAFDRIRRYLLAVTHHVELVGPVKYGEFETVKFRVAKDTGPPLEFNSESMSDGTLRALAALTAVFQSVPHFGAPRLVAIDEPETVLHPAAMRAMMAAFDEATARTQIILTTHSPDLLDCAEIGPENIRVVEMFDGKTAIGPVEEFSIGIVKDGLSTWGGLARDRQLKLEPPESPRPITPNAAEAVQE